MTEISSIRFDGGRLCLDFVNTIHDRFEIPKRDYLNSIDDLVDWAAKAKGIDIEQNSILKKNEQQVLANAEKFLNETIDLRELLYSMFFTISHNKKVKIGDLEKFNKIISKSFSKLRIEQNQQVFSEKWKSGTEELEKIILPIIKDAYELLLLNLPSKIKECPKCGWLFFDSSKNGRRKWCSMETCGSQHKANEWYHRNKG